MRYDIISADGHIDLRYLPPGTFTSRVPASTSRFSSTTPCSTSRTHSTRRCATASPCSPSSWAAERVAIYQIVSWRDIPATIEARDAAGVVTLPLSERFQALIDAAAMQLGLAGSDAYLEHWQRTDGGERPGTAREVGEAVVAELEARFTEFIGRAFRPA